MEEKAVKVAGWPAHVVKDCLLDPRLLANWPLLILALNKKLIGDELNGIFAHSPGKIATTRSMSKDEIEALGAYYVEPSTLVMPLFSAPVELHIVVLPNDPTLNSELPPMYITSPLVPAYIRLHLLSQFLQAVKLDNFFEAEEGLLMAAMRFLEGEWASIEDHGPPDVLTVLQHLVPRPIPLINSVTVSAVGVSTTPKTRNRTGGHSYDNRTSDEIKKEFNAMCKDVKYREILAARTKLPAFSAKEKFLGMLEQSRVVVVVGETGKFLIPSTSLAEILTDSNT
jgi:ATP-dependent RNA helicase DHX57